MRIIPGNSITVKDPDENTITHMTTVPKGGIIQFGYAYPPSGWEAVKILTVDEDNNETTVWIEYEQFITMANEIIRMKENHDE